MLDTIFGTGFSLKALFAKESNIDVDT